MEDEEKFEEAFLKNSIQEEIYTAFYYSNFRKFEENINISQERI